MRSAYVAAEESKGRVSGREKVNRQLGRCWLCACRQKVDTVNRCR